MVTDELISDVKRIYDAYKDRKLTDAANFDKRLEDLPEQLKQTSFYFNEKFRLERVVQALKADDVLSFSVEKKLVPKNITYLVIGGFVFLDILFLYDIVSKF